MTKTPAVTVRMHELKTWPRYFADILHARKFTEFRRHDRDFRIGDRLRLREWNPEKKLYTGREVLRCVRFMYTPNEAPDFVVLEVEPVL